MFSVDRAPLPLSTRCSRWIARRFPWRRVVRGGSRSVDLDATWISVDCAALTSTRRGSRWTDGVRARSPRCRSRAVVASGVVAGPSRLLGARREGRGVSAASKVASRRRSDAVGRRITRLVVASSRHHSLARAYVRDSTPVWITRGVEAQSPSSHLHPFVTCRGEWPRSESRDHPPRYRSSDRRAESTSSALRHIRPQRGFCPISRPRESAVSSETGCSPNIASGG